ncbi:MAG: hypothetical protein VX672_04760 [Planctomycetota bacterium]|nr:hypothetical protein [Planctomycetota bacterium]
MVDDAGRSQSDVKPASIDPDRPGSGMHAACGMRTRHSETSPSSRSPARGGWTFQRVVALERTRSSQGGLASITVTGRPERAARADRLTCRRRVSSSEKSLPSATTTSIPSQRIACSIDHRRSLAESPGGVTDNASSANPTSSGGRSREPGDAAGSSPDCPGRR